MTTLEWISIIGALATINFVSGIFSLYLAYDFKKFKEFTPFHIIFACVGVCNMVVSSAAFYFIIKHLETL